MLSTHNIGIDTEDEFYNKLSFPYWVKDDHVKKIITDLELNGDEVKRSFNYDQVREWKILDARKLADDGTNKLIDYARLIMIGYFYISHNNHVIVCCHAGISRSNAIAIGILTECGASPDMKPMDFYDAWALVRNKVPISNPEPCHISALSKLFGLEDLWRARFKKMTGVSNETI